MEKKIVNNPFKTNIAAMLTLSLSFGFFPDTVLTSLQFHPPDLQCYSHLSSIATVALSSCHLRPSLTRWETILSAVQGAGWSPMVSQAYQGAPW